MTLREHLNQMTDEELAKHLDENNFCPALGNCCQENHHSCVNCITTVLNEEQAQQEAAVRT